MHSSHECLIWGSPYSASLAVGRRSDAVLVNSSRAGGIYEITLEGRHAIQNSDESAKARLTTWLMDERSRGADVPFVTSDIVQYAHARAPLPVYERATRLLVMIAERSHQVGASVPIRQQIHEGDYYWYVRSESTNSSSVDRGILDDVGEINFLLEYLEEKGWIDGTWNAVVTVEGYGAIADRATGIESSQVFVAMWFDEQMDEPYDKGIRLGIEDVGYSAMRIDQKEHVNKIDDEIIAEIRRSRFLVADFTQGQDGARGGVYFEAGFAFGLGIPVIYTCRKDMIEKLAFDTRQYNHIFWECNEDLRRSLGNRIAATIGRHMM